MTVNSDTLLTTLAVFGVISLVVYFVLTRTHHRHPNRAATLPLRPSAGRNGVTGVVGAENGSTTATHQNNNKTVLREPCLRVPPHVSEESAKIAVNGGSNILVDGIVAFRHSRASHMDESLSKEQIAENRKDLARVLSRLLTGQDGQSGTSISTPPSKGSNVVVSVKLNEVGCEKLQRILFLLAAFYNLFVLVVVEQKEQFEGQEREEVISRLRGHDSYNIKSADTTTPIQETININALPSHRVVAATSVTGRVAFVRQLERVDLVLDFEEEVKDILNRFSYKVFVYRKSDRAQNGVSALGSALL
jgi:hypothetical protein